MEEEEDVLQEFAELVQLELQEENQKEKNTSIDLLKDIQDWLVPEEQEELLEEYAKELEELQEESEEVEEKSQEKSEE